MHLQADYLLATMHRQTGSWTLISVSTAKVHARQSVLSHASTLEGSGRFLFVICIAILYKCLVVGP